MPLSVSLICKADPIRATETYIFVNPCVNAKLAFGLSRSSLWPLMKPAKVEVTNEFSGIPLAYDSAAAKENFVTSEQSLAVALKEIDETKRARKIVALFGKILAFITLPSI